VSWHIYDAGTRRIVATLEGSRETCLATARKLANALGHRVLVSRAGAPGCATPRRAARRPAKKRVSAQRRTRAAARRGRRGKRPTRNPGLEAAAATFRKWNGFDPNAVQTTRAQRAIPRTLVRLGELVSVVYRSDKWSGKPKLYEHRTARPHPLLCTGPNGRGLYWIGGRTRVTARGLVH